jgi:flagellin
VANATAAITKIDTSINDITNLRATTGAGLSRLDQVVSSLETTSSNLSSARGRIMDADFAKETANLTRAQILQQAGTAMLAQANQLPNNVLSLLR